MGLNPHTQRGVEKSPLPRQTHSGTRSTCPEERSAMACRPVAPLLNGNRQACEMMQPVASDRLQARGAPSTAWRRRMRGGTLPDTQLNTNFANSPPCGCAGVPFLFLGALCHSPRRPPWRELASVSETEGVLGVPCPLPPSARRCRAATSLFEGGKGTAYHTRRPLS